MNRDLSLQKGNFDWMYLSRTRYLLIPVIALLTTFVLSYKTFAFDAPPFFPIDTFLIVLGCGLLMCQGNMIQYRRLNRRESPYRMSMDRLWRQLLTFGASSVAVMLSVMLVMSIIVNIDLSLSNIAGNSIIILCISTIHAMVLFVRDTAFPGPGTTFTHTAVKTNENHKVIIRNGSKIHQLKWRDIAYFHSSQGVIVAVTCDHHRYSTDFNSLGEIAARTKTSDFFQINRQMIVNREAVKNVLPAPNRRLSLEVEPFFSSFNGEGTYVSRRKVPQFRKWFNGAQNS